MYITNTDKMQAQATNDPATFDFFGTNEKHIYTVNSDLHLHIKQTSNSAAILYFTDAADNTIVIPSGIIVYTFDFQNKQKRVILKPIDDKYYALCCTDDYIVELNGIVILEINSQRKWSIVAKPADDMKYFAELRAQSNESSEDSWLDDEQWYCEHKAKWGGCIHVSGPILRNFEELKELINTHFDSEI